MMNRKKILGFEQERELNGWPVQKYCKGCGRILPQDHFHLDRRIKDGLSDKCNECVYKRHDKWLERIEKTRKKKLKKEKMKECQICHEIRPINWFNKNKSTKDGYGQQCNICRKEVLKENVKIWTHQRKEKKIKQEKMKCRICKQVLPISSFSKSRHTKNGYFHHCKNCHKKMDKQFQRRWEKERNRKDFEFSLDLRLEKKCKLCGKNLPLSMFWFRRASKDGHSHYCKNCSSIKIKKRNKRLKERGFPKELIPDEKQCAKCKQVLSKNHFRKDSTSSTGLDDYCKDCRNEYYRQYSSRPEVKQKKKEYSRLPEVMKRKRKQARKYSRRPEVAKRIKAYKKEYRKRDYVKKKRREYEREYRKRPEVIAKKKEYDSRPEVRKRRAKTTNRWKMRKRHEKIMSQN